MFKLKSASSLAVYMEVLNYFVISGVMFDKFIFVLRSVFECFGSDKERVFRSSSLKLFKFIWIDYYRRFCVIETDLQMGEFLGDFYFKLDSLFPLSLERCKYEL